LNGSSQGKGVKTVSATLITTLIALAFFALLLIVKFSNTIRRERLSNGEENLHRIESRSAGQTPEGRSLFHEKQLKTAHELPSRAAAKESGDRRQELLTRAHFGDVTSLEEAANADFYDHALFNLVNFATYQNDQIERSEGALKERAPSEQFALMREYSSYITSRALRSNNVFVTRYIALWQAQPGEKTLAQMLHLAALSNDAKVYLNAIEAAREVRQRGSLPEVSAKDFIALCESHYWLLNREARASGDGFALKNALAELRQRVSDESGI
jgi:hypothetical protein